MWGLQKNVWNTCFTWQTDEAYNRYQVILSNFAVYYCSTVTIVIVILIKELSGLNRTGLFYL